VNAFLHTPYSKSVWLTREKSALLAGLEDGRVTSVTEHTLPWRLNPLPEHVLDTGLAVVRTGAAAGDHHGGSR
jgi:hypothetical protein